MDTLAMDNCRLHLRIELIEKTLSAFSNLPLARLEQEKRVKQLKEAYAVSLGAYDNARAGTKWLKQNCRLIYKQLMIEQELLEQQQASNQREVLRLRGQLAHLYKLTEEHDRRLLMVGMHYLDRNFSGFIEPNDVPEMSATLFNLLDQNNKHRLSADDLERTILNLNAKMDKLRETIQKAVAEKHNTENLNAVWEARGPAPAANRAHGPQHSTALQMEQIKVKLVQQQTRIDALNKELMECEYERRAIYQAFQRGFVNEMMRKLDHVRNSDLPGLIDRILEGPTVESIQIGLANTDIKIDGGELKYYQPQILHDEEITMRERTTMVPRPGSYGVESQTFSAIVDGEPLQILNERSAQVAREPSAERTEQAMRTPSRQLGSSTGDEQTSRSPSRHIEQEQQSLPSPLRQTEQEQMPQTLSAQPMQEQKQEHLVSEPSAQQVEQKSEPELRRRRVAEPSSSFSSSSSASLIEERLASNVTSSSSVSSPVLTEERPVSSASDMVVSSASSSAPMEREERPLSSNSMSRPSSPSQQLSRPPSPLQTLAAPKRLLEPRELSRPQPLPVSESSSSQLTTIPTQSTQVESFTSYGDYKDEEEVASEAQETQILPSQTSRSPQLRSGPASRSPIMPRDARALLSEANKLPPMPLLNDKDSTASLSEANKLPPTSLLNTPDMEPLVLRATRPAAESSSSSSLITKAADSSSSSIFSSSMIDKVPMTEVKTAPESSSLIMPITQQERPRVLEDHSLHDEKLNAVPNGGHTQEGSMEKQATESSSKTQANMDDSQQQPALPPPKRRIVLPHSSRQQSGGYRPRPSPTKPNTTSF